MCLHIFSESFEDTDVERKDSTGEAGGNKGDFFPEENGISDSHTNKNIAGRQRF